MRVPRSTLEQWSVLKAIVDHGGFAQAAEALHRSQSSVSYMVARLQEQLSVELLAIEGRKARLTEQGGGRRPLPHRSASGRGSAFGVSSNSQRARTHASPAPASCAALEAGASIHRIPPKLSGKLRAVVTAGFANEVDAGNQEAAAM